MIAGELVDIGAPVVLWFEEHGYNAYRTKPRFSNDGEVGLRYSPGRPVTSAGVPPATQERLERGRASAADLAQVVDQFVIHYDVCGTSQVCFRVLQDMRMLSVHFMLDLDGTLYQTLDLKDKAWHAAKANGRSIGVEIAQIGAYPRAKADDENGPLHEWYTDAPDGTTRITLPERFGDGDFFDPAAHLTPATPGRKQGRVQGEQLFQYDFTRAQYETLAHLAAALNRKLPKIKLDVPRTATGEVLPLALDEEAWQSYQGLLGHFHVTTRKIDPGPAFDWDSLLSRARALRAEMD